MPSEFNQVQWDQQTVGDCRELVQLALQEDLDDQLDLTTCALIDADAVGQARLVAREAGVACGMHAGELILHQVDADAHWRPCVADGSEVTTGMVLANVVGRARALLTAERTLLNFIGRLSGVATLTREFVRRAAGTRTRIYDTRKTTPGWRRLEKYAVRQGGGRNHRTGLFDAVLIKDNHLALVGRQTGQQLTPAQAIAKTRQRLEKLLDGPATVMIEIEVDTLQQLEQVLGQRPDIVLLDNMEPDQLRRAVMLRDALQPATQLEASGGVSLDTVAEIAATGVDRISVGALTHSARSLDVALDWDT